MTSAAQSQTGIEYKIYNKTWSAAGGDFSAWQLDGATLTQESSVQLDPGTAHTGTDPHPGLGYSGHNFYNGEDFLVGEAISPEVEPGFAFAQAVPSWNADTPGGTWVETLVRVRMGSRWTGWYNLGVWASSTLTVDRHSVSGQRDNDGTVSTDTLALDHPEGTNTLQVKVRLFSAQEGVVPTLRNAGISASTNPHRPEVFAQGNPALWNRLIDVPQCSQMVYPDGGNVWCSPTSVSMALAYWTKDAGPCEPRVRAAVSGVYDWLYDGHGNWPFNAAYAATHGFESFVARFSSLAQLEEWVAAGVPVVISYAWEEGDLEGAPVRSSDGHLGVLCGFNGEGNPIVNDPAARTDDAVRRTYRRQEFERIWLEHSGGTVYLIYPPGHQVSNL